jgi:hypothetical protein
VTEPCPCCCWQINLDSDEEDTRDSQQSEQPAAAAPPKPASPEPAPQQPERRRSAVQLDPGVRDLLEANKRLMAELQRAAQDTLDGGCWVPFACMHVASCYVFPGYS